MEQRVCSQSSHAMQFPIMSSINFVPKNQESIFTYYIGLRGQKQILKFTIDNSLKQTERRIRFLCAVLNIKLQE